MSINQNTKVTLTIGGVIAAIIALIGVGWRAGGIMADIKGEITELRRDIILVSKDRWSTSDMERWAYRLERANREQALVVPDVRESKANRGD